MNEESSVRIETKKDSQKYEISVGHELLEASGEWAREITREKAGKAVLISNEKVFGLYGEPVRESFRRAGFEVSEFLIGDGEEYKSFETLRETLDFFSRRKLSRTDAVVALGGGVVGDLTGFAASVYLRGIDFLQIPTTLLAMIDSSVGGKTAVNTEFGKNLVGTFYQPKGVLIDSLVLETLEHREVVAGFCEAIKQGAIGSRELFVETQTFLQNFPVKDFARNFSDPEFIAALEKLLLAQIRFKAEIVREDERESHARLDAKSRKILNFGHTTAHALEKVTEYRRFKHGEAVGYGMLVAAEIAKRLDICDKDSVKLLNDVVGMLGELPAAGDLEIDRISEAFAYDKKSVGDQLQWILLKSIGTPVILQSQEIPRSIIRESLIKILKG